MGQLWGSSGPRNAVPEEATLQQSTLVLGNTAEQDGASVWLMSVNS